VIHFDKMWGERRTDRKRRENGSMAQYKSTTGNTGVFYTIILALAGIEESDNVARELCPICRELSTYQGKLT